MKTRLKVTKISNTRVNLILAGSNSLYMHICITGVSIRAVLLPGLHFFLRIFNSWNWLSTARNSQFRACITPHEAT